MFSKLFKRNKKDDKYTLTELTENDKKYLLRFKENQLERVETSKYPYQIGIAIPLKSKNKNGFPTGEENAQLFTVEDRLIDEFTKEDIAIYVGTITGGGAKE